jgi:Mg-chelatase subunit ChlD
MGSTRWIWASLVLGGLVGCGAESSASSGGSGKNTSVSGGTDAFGNVVPGTPGTVGAAGAGAMAAGGGGKKGGGGFSGPSCAGAMVVAARVRPTVMLIVDGSGSMDDDFGGMSRWNALRASLMDPGGVVPTLELAIDFGITIYDGPASAVASGILNAIFPPAPGTPPPPMGACFRLVELAPTVMNWMPIWNVYPNAPLGGSTPTQNAMKAVVEKMPDLATVQADPNIGDQVIVLATDGAPNEFCGGNVDAQAEVVSLTTMAAAKGIKVFVISLAGNDAALQTHLETVAAAGGTMKPPFTPMDQASLTASLQSILGDTISCEIVLNGTVTAGSECRGSVQLAYAGAGTETLDCNGADGWKLKDGHTIELVGKACDNLRNSPMAMVNAGFPCGVFTVE